jgi:hypothetical protein
MEVVRNPDLAGVAQEVARVRSGVKRCAGRSGHPSSRLNG